MVGVQTATIKLAFWNNDGLQTLFFGYNKVSIQIKRGVGDVYRPGFGK